MDIVDQALASPRGRFFSGTLAQICSTGTPAGEYSWSSSPEDVRALIEAVDLQRVSEMREWEIVDALSFATDWARYWQPPDEQDVTFARPEIVAALRPVASAVLESPHASWWSEPVDRTRQRVVAQKYSSDPWPESTAPYRPDSAGLDAWRAHTMEMEERFRIDRIERPASRVSGEWWSTPAGSTAVSTTRATANLGAVELMLEEDSSGLGEARIWAVHVRDGARVYEITCPAEWAHLVGAYPLAVPESKRSDWFDTTGEYREWFVPDWTAVAQDFDGVHLTVLGYLSTPGLAISLPGNVGATVLAGWDADSTWWLDSAGVVIDDDPQLWRREGGRWAQM